jgi:hypothetical protein
VASRAAAASIHFPLLDWSRMTGRRPNVTCATTGDGVHVQQWVDLLRARLLLSYLCDADDDFRFRPLVSEADVARSFDPVRARCVIDPAAASAAAADGGAVADGRETATAARRARYPLSDADAAQLRNGTATLRSFIHLARLHGKPRVTIWQVWAANRTCIHDGTGTPDDDDHFIFDGHVDEQSIDGRKADSDAHAPSHAAAADSPTD